MRNTLAAHSRSEDFDAAPRRPGARTKARQSVLSRVFGVKRMSVFAVLGIAGLAAIGVPMNALFFQDGHHPSPLFAGHAPPAGETARAANAQSGAPADKLAAASVEADATTPASARADLAVADLARLAADPSATMKSARAPAKAAKPETAKAAPLKPATAKAQIAKAHVAKVAAANMESVVRAPNNAVATKLASVKPVAVGNAAAPASVHKAVATKAVASKSAPIKTAQGKPVAKPAAKAHAGAAEKVESSKSVAAAEAPHVDGPMSLLNQLFGGVQPKAAAPAADQTATVAKTVKHAHAPQKTQKAAHKTDQHAVAAPQ